MLGKILIGSGIAYGILSGMGNAFEFVVYLRSLMLLIFFGSLIAFALKGIKWVATKLKLKPSETNINFKGI